LLNEAFDLWFCKNLPISVQIAQRIATDIILDDIMNIIQSKSFNKTGDLRVI